MVTHKVQIFNCNSLGLVLQADAGRRSNSGSPLPDWLSENNSPVKTLELLTDSDEVLEVASSEDGIEDGPGPGPGSAVAEKQPSKKRGREAAPQGRRKVQRVLLSSENDSDGGEEGSGKGQQSAEKGQRRLVATQQSQMQSSQDSAGPLDRQQPQPRKPAGSNGKAALAKIPEEEDQVRIVWRRE